MNDLTVKSAKDYIVRNYGEPRHNIGCLVRGIRRVSKDTGLAVSDLFFLMIENQPIEGAYTHSYGFHTSNGRHLIDTMANNYYNELSKLN